MKRDLHDVRAATYLEGVKASSSQLFVHGRRKSDAGNQDWVIPSLQIDLTAS